MSNFHLWKHIWEFFCSLEHRMFAEFIELVEDALPKYGGVEASSVLLMRDLISLGYPGINQT